MKKDSPADGRSLRMNCLSACNTTLVFLRRCIIRPMRHFRLGMIGVFALALFTVAAAQPPAQLVIANVRVFTGERSIERASITVADGKIVRITADAPATTGVTIDGAGKTALPGLIDSHIHVLDGATEAETRAFIKDRLPERLQSFLRHGVTTVKSVGDTTELILKVPQISETELLQGLGSWSWDRSSPRPEVTPRSRFAAAMTGAAPIWR